MLISIRSVSVTGLNVIKAYQFITHRDLSLHFSANLPSFGLKKVWQLHKFGATVICSWDNWLSVDWNIFSDTCGFEIMGGVILVYLDRTENTWLGLGDSQLSYLSSE